MDFKLQQNRRWCGKEHNRRLLMTNTRLRPFLTVMLPAPRDCLRKAMVKVSLRVPCNVILHRPRCLQQPNKYPNAASLQSGGRVLGSLPSLKIGPSGLTITHHVFGRLATRAFAAMVIQAPKIHTMSEIASLMPFKRRSPVLPTPLKKTPRLIHSPSEVDVGFEGHCQVGLLATGHRWSSAK